MLREAPDLRLALERLGLPLIVKPGSQGSSVGMTRVRARRGSAGSLARRRCASIRWCSRKPGSAAAEYTVAILQGRALPSIRIETPRAFYDYEAKYLREDTRYFCPSGLSAQAEEHLARLALAAFDACGAEGWGRADFMMDRTGRPLLLEINTVPGMTDHSLVPMAAHAAGIDFDELVWRVLETSFARAAGSELTPWPAANATTAGGAARARRLPALPFGLSARRVGWSVAAVLLAGLALAGLDRLLDQPIAARDRDRPTAARLAARRGAGGARAPGSRRLRDREPRQHQPRAGARCHGSTSAAVQRSWPQGLTVQIVEQTAVARWNGDGLVNARGELFLSDAHLCLAAAAAAGRAAGLGTGGHGALPGDAGASDRGGTASDDGVAGRARGVGIHAR